VSPLDETPPEPGPPAKPDFMVWPPIPEAPYTVPGEPPPPPRRRHRSITFRLLGILLVLCGLLAGGGVTAVLVYEHHLDNNIGRIGNPFAALPEKARPKPLADGATDILMLGSDSKISVDPSNWALGAQHTDAIMIAHIPADRSRVTVTSIPPDSWVTVPGHGKNQINAGYALGGPTLMVQTVENLTHVRIDHIMIVDFEGFKDITDELGGVRVNVASTTSNAKLKFAPGVQTMDGATALRYVRQRHNLPGGDFNRVARQQTWIRAVSVKTLEKGTLTNPITLNQVLNSLTSAISADDDFSIGRMRSLAVSLRGLRGDDLVFITAPVAGTGRSPDGKLPIVKLDAEANRSLWAALAGDDIPQWLAAHPEATRPAAAA